MRVHGLRLLAAATLSLTVAGVPAAADGHDAGAVRAVGDIDQDEPAGPETLEARAALHEATTSSREAAGSPSRDSALADAPLHFEPNLGQTHGDVAFTARAGGYTLFLTREEAVFVLTEPPSTSETTAPIPGEGPGDPYQQGRAHDLLDPEARPAQQVVRMRFVDAEPDPRITGHDPLPGKSNYFLGDDPAKWATDVPHHEKVVIHGLWPGIDAVFYASSESEKAVQYDFVVRPGADPALVQLAFDGARPLLDDEGALLLEAEDATLRQSPPSSYQGPEDAPEEVQSRFRLLGEGRVGVHVGAYDPTRSLVIDPIVYSTYLGGSGADAGWDIAVDADGSAYVVGEALSSDFPTEDPYQAERLGRVDVFVTKLSPAGDALVYSTYLGGHADSIGRAIAVDSEGHAYITASTAADDFPTTPLAFKTWGGGLIDPVVTKLSPQGNSLVYSTYVSTPTIEWALDIAVDDDGHAHITGATPATDFPTTPDSFQPSKASNWDAFVVKLNQDASGLIYGTYLGGDGNDRGQGIAIGPDGSAYVTGWTTSSDFPVHDAFQGDAGGGFDAFVTKLTPDGDGVAFSTYLGAAGDDRGHAVAVAPDGSALVTGIAGPEFPLEQAIQPLKGSRFGSDAFVTRFSPDADTLTYSTYLGGASIDVGWGVAVDSEGHAVVVGETESPNFPTTVSSAQPHKSGILGGDAFVTTVAPAGDEFGYSTYLGGVDREVAYGVGVDPLGDVYVTGLTRSLNFPTKGAYQPVKSDGLRDAFVTKFTPGACSPHPPIRVTEEHGLEGFTWTNPVTGETEPRPGSGVTQGDGSEEDPYLIEGWCIAAPPGAGIEAGIHVVDTSAHVLIQNNSIESDLAVPAAAGILVRDASNLAIAENTITGNSMGVSLLGSTDNVVRGNTITDNSGNGVFLSNASNNNEVRANTVAENTRHGVSISGSSNNNVLRDNTIANNAWDGMFIGGASRGQVVRGNTITGNRQGMAFSGGGSNAVHGNTITSNNEYGLFLRSSSTNVLYDNTVSDNTHGAYLSQSSSNNTVRDNAITENKRHGVSLSLSSNNNVLRDNTIVDNGWDGIFVAMSRGNVVRGNTITGSRQGTAFLDSSDDNVVQGNTITSNSEYGIFLRSSSNNVVSDNTVSDNNQGLFLSESSANAFHGNNIHDNGGGLLAKDLGLPVDARNNWWGHGTGPSGDVVDGCTGREAEGEGDAIAIDNAGVCFDAWLTEPNPDAGAGS